MTGYDFVRALESSENLSHKPIIILTAKEGMKDLFEAEGVKDYMIKPFEPEELIAKTPDYTVFNGHVDAFKDDNALTADTGDTVRIFFGNSGQNTSNCEMILRILRVGVPVRQEYPLWTPV